MSRISLGTMYPRLPSMAEMVLYTRNRREASGVRPPRALVADDWARAPASSISTSDILLSIYSASWLITINSMQSRSKVSLPRRTLGLGCLDAWMLENEKSKGLHAGAERRKDLPNRRVQCNDPRLGKMFPGMSRHPQRGPLMAGFILVKSMLAARPSYRCCTNSFRQNDRSIRVQSLGAHGARKCWR